MVKIKDDSNNVIEAISYGADRSRLICETGSGRTYYAWGGISAIGEYTEATASTTPAWSKDYVYAGTRLLSTETNGIGTEYHHPDRLGTKLITDTDVISPTNYGYEQSTLPFGTALD
ncbi:MAG: hypothetical protein ACREO5_06370, partial [Candidatus Binatia bacterium]